MTRLKSGILKRKSYLPFKKNYMKNKINVDINNDSKCNSMRHFIFLVTEKLVLTKSTTKEHFNEGAKETTRSMSSATDSDTTISDDDDDGHLYGQYHEEVPLKITKPHEKSFPRFNTV